MAIGQKRTFTCNDTDAEVDDTLSNTVVLTCMSNGSFVPANWGTCAIPPECTDPPSAAGDLVVKADTPASTKAYRYEE